MFGWLVYLVINREVKRNIGLSELYQALWLYRPTLELIIFECEERSINL